MTPIESRGQFSAGCEAFEEITDAMQAPSATAPGFVRRPLALEEGNGGLPHHRHEGAAALAFTENGLDRPKPNPARRAA
jgi:hypothetical protein